MAWVIAVSTFEESPAASPKKSVALIVWLDGRGSVQLNEIRLGAPIDAAMFGKPESPR